MSKQHTVVVTNMSGQAVSILGHRIKPLRETAKEQEFGFDKDQTAQEFDQTIKKLNIRGLSAIYAGVEVESDGGKDQTLEEQLRENTVAELKAKCKLLGITGYSSLKEDDLINLILEKNSKQEGGE
ncbi:Rho termination factor N-terminal domain-containing protein [Aliivibrio salmonicida]|uniref:Rho termination factor N-terminal domain-containing protein n=1 Tax=Aliivibrio salmonicida TaxID=40269 RepID=UPI003D0973FB